jgi:bacillithiol synthase
MSGECLSFNAIPQVSALFRDYLYNFPQVHRFYQTSPHDRAQIVANARTVKQEPRLRAEVAKVLDRQNRGFGSSPAALANIERLRNGAVAAVTGQQVGLFGGPLYSILKAASAIRFSRDLSLAGIDCVPVFWLATEDHDLEEVNHVTLLNSDGLLERLQSASAGANGAPVSQVMFGDEIASLVRHACDLFGNGETADALRQSYRPGESFGTAFAKLFARLFAGSGLVLLDPSDPGLHDLAAPIYRQAVERAESLNQALLKRGRELREAGYHEQVKVTRETTLLFEEREGARTPIHRANGGFTVGTIRSSSAELLSRIDAEPRRFSANVLLRPVVQDYLLPTAAYFAGPAEIAYFAQLDVVRQELLGRRTTVLPRLSVTLVDARAQRLIAKYGLGLPDFFAGPDAVHEKLARRQLPADVGLEFDRAAAELEQIAGRLTATLQKLDPTLVRSAERSRRKIFYQFDRLRRRAGNAELSKNKEIAAHAEWLGASLYPDKHLQEREIAGISFVARYGEALLDRFVEAAGACCDHQLLYL